MPFVGSRELAVQLKVFPIGYEVILTHTISLNPQVWIRHLSLIINRLTLVIDDQ